jgi:hypothetical protein
MITEMVIMVKTAHPSLVPSWIAAVSGSMAAVIASVAGWFMRHSNRSQSEMMSNMTKAYLEGTELLLKQQQAQFEQFIRDYFRKG